MTRAPLLALLAMTPAPCLGRHAQNEQPAQVPLAGPQRTTPFTEDFGSFVQSTLDEFKVPGISVAVVDGEKTFSKGFGYATLPDVEATPETLWLGASTTKAFVGATLSQFIQNKTYPDLLKKGWATPIADVIPDDFVLTDDWATRHVTIEDGISHRTGLPRHDLSWSHTTKGLRTPVRDVVRSLRNLPLTAEPRAIFQYCNLMYVVLSHVIETLTKKPLKDTFQELIWGPLNMTSTFLDLDEAKKSPNYLATGYYWDKKTQSYGTVKLDTLQESGAAGIITNVLDHAKWVRSLIYETGPLSNATHADIRKPRFISNAEPTAGMDVTLYGLGWSRTKFHGETLFQHSGQSLSFGTTIFWLPERKYGVIVMGNVFLQANMVGAVVARKLVEDALGIDAADRFDIAKKSREDLAKEDREYSEAVKTLYPNITQGQPPTAGLHILAGEYHDAGYGTLVFKKDRENQQDYLLAQRRDAVYQYKVRLVHVSGDEWVAYYESLSGSRLPSQFFKAKFKFDEKDRPTALDIAMGDGTPGTEPFTVTFGRVASRVKSLL
ncbi:hypothetical protein NLG97_g3378 [Lecanicillium saksenae]|uniref:Uncharacterized protein n=1 Tax=Lecanicillium saksenae TaxID=468837 RepID=A0ACC1QZH3_9HYPO|nr:hypothetical protein NLG97_g3378 [Lecanicillium saksenae]